MRAGLARSPADAQRQRSVFGRPMVDRRQPHPVPTQCGWRAAAVPADIWPGTSTAITRRNATHDGARVQRFPNWDGCAPQSTLNGGMTISRTDAEKLSLGWRTVRGAGRQSRQCARRLCALVRPSLDKRVRSPHSCGVHERVIHATADLRCAIRGLSMPRTRSHR
jgi:hypothetical protein